MINLDNFIFHPDLSPFIITKNFSKSINSGGYIAANQTKKIYGEWESVKGSNIGFQIIVKVDNKSQIYWLEHGLKFESDGVSRKVVGTGKIESDFDRVRPVLEIVNFKDTAQNFTPKDFKFYIYVYKVNIK